MKIKPEILLTKKQTANFKKILITGTDETLVNEMVSFFLNKFKNEKFHIDTSGFLQKDVIGDLFSESKVVFFLKESFFNKESLDLLSKLDCSVVIYSTNTKKISSYKSYFIKEKDSLLVECYALDKSAKEIVLKDFVERKNIYLSAEVFWYIIESFESSYVFFIKQLETLYLYKNKIDQISDVNNAVLPENNIEINKIIFNIFKKNSTLIEFFNRNIYSQTDFYFFLNSFKFYLSILESPNRETLLSKFPRYLFREKDVFIKIYEKLNHEKIIKIYDNILRVEKLIRRNSSLYLVIGLRFLLNTKKIIIS